MGWEVLALPSVLQGLGCSGAPGWEFFFPLLCLDSRPAESRDQQSKSSCSSSQALLPFPQGVFCWEDLSVHRGRAGQGCAVGAP